MLRLGGNLFLKIFLWFWLLLTVVSVANLLLFLKDAGEVREHRLSRDVISLKVFGSAALDLHEQGRQDLIAELADQYLHGSRLEIFLRDGEGTPLLGNAFPPIADRAAASSLIGGKPQIFEAGGGLWIVTRVTGVRSGATGVAAQRISRSGALPPPFQPHILWQRFAVAFVLSGILAWLLARSLSLPIARLKMTTRRLADGDLEVRAPVSVTRRGDEIGDLAREFDIMASRTQELLISRDRMIRDISHELRSPLARLGVALELAYRNAPEDIRGSLDRIGRESVRLNELIGQLLTLSFMQDGGGTLPKEQFELDTVIRDVVRDADFEAREHGCTVRIEKLDNLTVYGHQEMIRQAVENVVRNAVRHTGEGTAVDVFVEKKESPESNRAVIRVRDHGPGVPETHLKNIFQPFYRVAEARERITGGTGIGLAITHRAVQMHGGAVTASNAPGGGLIVEISVPV